MIVATIVLKIINLKIKIIQLLKIEITNFIN